MALAGESVTRPSSRTQAFRACLAAALSALARKTRITGITCGPGGPAKFTAVVIDVSCRFSWGQTFGMTPISVSQGADPTNR